MRLTDTVNMVLQKEMRLVFDSEPPTNSLLPSPVVTVPQICRETYSPGQKKIHALKKTIWALKQ